MMSKPPDWLNDVIAGRAGPLPSAVLGAAAAGAGALVFEKIRPHALLFAGIGAALGAVHASLQTEASRSGTSSHATGQTTTSMAYTYEKEARWWDGELDAHGLTPGNADRAIRLLVKMIQANDDRAQHFLDSLRTKPTWADPSAARHVLDVVEHYINTHPQFALNVGYAAVGWVDSPTCGPDPRQFIHRSPTPEGSPLMPWPLQVYAWMSCLWRSGHPKFVLDVQEIFGDSILACEILQTIPASTVE